MKPFKAGIALRGKWIEENLVQFGGRSTGIVFLSPDPRKYLEVLPLRHPGSLGDLYRLDFKAIVDYVKRLGARLKLEDNPYLQESLEASCLTSSLTPPLLAKAYASLPHMFSADFASELVENTIGIDNIERWMPKTLNDGRRVRVRAFGARSLHIIAGNNPLVAGMTVLRNLLTRSDGIIKSPSNDPFTALAIARTMIDMDPDHPLTRHLSVAYWKGGDEALEQKLYHPKNIEKIVAWGGFASVKHVTKYIQPGLELISLDPKRSISIVGAEAFADEQRQRDVALRLATDIGAVNQEACCSARVIYVLSGTDEQGLAKLNRLAELTYAALMNLPADVTTPAKEMDPDLRSSLNAARLNDEYYYVVGGTKDEGAVIVSQLPAPVDFATNLSSRVANLVPVDDIEEICGAVDAYTQTVGVYPESLKEKLLDRLSLFGVQRFTSLGFAAHPSLAVPQDGLELMRQLCKWIVCEDCDPAVTTPLWENGTTFESIAA